MKRIIATLAALVTVIGMAGAQDMAQVTEIYNSGVAALGSDDKDGAIKYFESAIKMAGEIGEEADEVAAKCKDVIPSVHLSIAKDLAKEANYDGCIARLDQAIAKANEYGKEEVASEAEALKPQIYMSKATGLLKDKDYAGAAAAYESVLAIEPENGNAALRLATAYNGAGNTDKAKAAFELAATLGKEADAYKQLANIYLKEASALLKAKDYKATVAAALKVNEYNENPTAYQLAGQASQLAGNNNDAIKYFEKFLEVSPDNKNAGQIAYTVGALYQTAGNKAKAREFYEKAVNDPKYGADAKKLLDSLK